MVSIKDEDMQRIKTNLANAVDHPSNHWIEDCRMLVAEIEARDYSIALWQGKDVE